MQVDTPAGSTPPTPTYPYLPHTHRTTHASIPRSRHTPIHETACDIP
nr:MAG TPA: hypothetical protein [Caudoviricetes sp.]